VAPRYRVRQGESYTGMPVRVLDWLPKLRGRAPAVLIAAFAQSRPSSGGWWAYGNSREVAAAIGASPSTVREAFAILMDADVFVEHEPPSNAATAGRVRLNPELWIYEHE